MSEIASWFIKNLTFIRFKENLFWSILIRFENNSENLMLFLYCVHFLSMKVPEKTQSLKILTTGTSLCNITIDLHYKIKRNFLNKWSHQSFLYLFKKHYLEFLVFLKSWSHEILFLYLFELSEFQINLYENWE